MSWRVLGRYLSIPGCLLLIGLMPVAAFVTTRIYAWWWAIVPGISAINGHFKGTIIPFGALVDFRPPKPILNKFPKFEKRSMPGVFLGYYLMSGERWYGDFLVAPLNDFEPTSGWCSRLPC